MKAASRPAALAGAACLVPLFAFGGDMPRDVTKLHTSALVFDAHCDTAMRLIGDRAIDLGVRHETGHMDLPRMKEGGLDAQVFAVWVNPQLPPERWLDRAREMIAAIREQAKRHPDTLAIALRGAEIERIAKKGKVAAVIGVEGGHAIGDDLAALRELHESGVRVLTLTWMNTNLWADASDDTARWGGLNDLGREVVREMDRLGMVIDCSHASDSTFFDVLETTRHPVLVSHSCMRALCDVPRNVSDDELRALARNGGVVCVNYFPGFLDREYYEASMILFGEARARARALADSAYGGDYEKAWEQISPEFRPRIAAIPLPTVARLVDHIDYAVKIAGIDHVGLGSDFDGIHTPPAGLRDVAQLAAVTAELKARGYSDAGIRKILGGNLLRLFKRVCR